ncbi:MAG: metalloprotease PmbA [Xanthomonadales bacterium]|nr:Metalloprotease PmbA [Xanthomonadales bacterium]MCC6591874.1 metalloprotease PmbA [Xanthomonadales bacterium]MCE7932878.1 metalloprotease PmbA [Xanthomonadales bacterium PRO6]
MPTALALDPNAPPHADLDRLAAIAQEVIARCRGRGADQVEVGVSVDSGLAVNVRLGEVETVEHTRDRGLSLTVYRGQRKGAASTADLAEDSIAVTIEQALAIARHTEADPAAGLADPALYASDFPDLDLWHPQAPDAPAAVALALRCESAALDFDPRIRNSEGAGVNSGRSYGVYANSLGFLGREYGTRHSLSCSVLAGEDEAMERDYHYDSARAMADLADATAIGREAARRTLMRLGARTLATRKAPAILSAELARGFFGHLTSAVAGGAQYRKASFLLDAVGQRVFPDWVRIGEQPHLRRAAGSSNYDDDGVATRASMLIEDGVLARYILGSYSARKLGLASTGNAGGVHNLVVQANAGSLAELFAEMREGLYVTEFLGQGVSTITGDYSRGAAGYWIENGQVAYPVSEITVAGNLREMYANLVAVGNEVDPRGNVRTGPVWLREVTVAGDGGSNE